MTAVQQIALTTKPHILEVVPATESAPETRRFQRPDLDRHGGWLLDRLATAYPHIQRGQLGGWLSGLIYNNECAFLYQPNAVGLAQVERANTLMPMPVIRERFVFARSAEFIDEAAWMYVEFERWAKHQGAEVIIVREGLTDVSADQIRAKFNNRRIFTREQTFLKVGEKG